MCAVFSFFRFFVVGVSVNTVSYIQHFEPNRRKEMVVVCSVWFVCTFNVYAEDSESRH